MGALKASGRSAPSRASPFSPTFALRAQKSTGQRRRFWNARHMTSARARSRRPRVARSWGQFAPFRTLYVRTTAPDRAGAHRAERELANDAAAHPLRSAAHPDSRARRARAQVCVHVVAPGEVKPRYIQWRNVLSICAYERRLLGRYMAATHSKTPPKLFPSLIAHRGGGREVARWREAAGWI